MSRHILSKSCKIALKVAPIFATYVRKKFLVIQLADGSVIIRDKMTKDKLSCGEN